jgi:acetyl-CoA carboxylase biotin carboxylase subunit
MKKVLIANRGEIALRLIRACRDLNLKTVAVYSTADRDALHVEVADEAICIGGPLARDSYLNIPQLLSAAYVTGADSIHPGYGFLSENSEFAQLCADSGILFIGPSARAISLLGDKAEAKETAKRAGCPIIGGSDGVVANCDEAKKIAQSLGYPVMIKAVAGGGGKGIRIAHGDDDFESNYSGAEKEALAAFGNPNLYIEKMILNPRHIEIQIVGDHHGNYIHLGERDCTIQRRRQKLIEETPSPVLTEQMRQKIGEAAIAIAREAKYTSLGTVEFLLDQQKNFYFMEMNTRIQVEHTITEELTGIDLAALQIEIAQGKPLPYTQDQVKLNGHVIQLRINAEDPSENFKPSAGTLSSYRAPGGPHLRIDSCCFEGGVIPPYYDSMVAKLIVRGNDRQQAIARSLRALKEFKVLGIKTTIPFHQWMLHNETFIQGEKYTLLYTDKLIEGGEKFLHSDDQ